MEPTNYNTRPGREPIYGRSGSVSRSLSPPPSQPSLRPSSSDLIGSPLQETARNRTMRREEVPALVRDFERREEMQRRNGRLDRGTFTPQDLGESTEENLINNVYPLENRMEDPGVEARNSARAESGAQPNLAFSSLPEERNRVPLLASDNQIGAGSTVSEGESNSNLSSGILPTTALEAPVSTAETTLNASNLRESLEHSSETPATFLLPQPSLGSWGEQRSTEPEDSSNLTFRPSPQPDVEISLPESFVPALNASETTTADLPTRQESPRGGLNLESSDLEVSSASRPSNGTVNSTSHVPLQTEADRSGNFSRPHEVSHDQGPEMQPIDETGGMEIPQNNDTRGLSDAGSNAERIEAPEGVAQQSNEQAGEHFPDEVVQNQENSVQSQVSFDDPFQTELVVAEPDTLPPDPISDTVESQESKLGGFSFGLGRHINWGSHRLMIGPKLQVGINNTGKPFFSLVGEITTQPEPHKLQVDFADGWGKQMNFDAYWKKTHFFYEKGSTGSIRYAQGAILHDYDSFLKKIRLGSVPYHHWGIGIKNKGCWWLFKDIESYYLLGATDEFRKNVPGLPFLGVSFKTQSLLTVPHKSSYFISRVKPIPLLTHQSQIKDFFHQQNKMADAVETLRDAQVESHKSMYHLIEKAEMKVKEGFSSLEHDLKNIAATQSVHQKALASAIENQTAQAEECCFELKKEIATNSNPFSKVPYSDKLFPFIGGSFLIQKLDQLISFIGIFGLQYYIALGIVVFQTFLFYQLSLLETTDIKNKKTASLIKCLRWLKYIFFMGYIGSFVLACTNIVYNVAFNKPLLSKFRFLNTTSKGHLVSKQSLDSLGKMSAPVQVFFETQLWAFLKPSSIQISSLIVAHPVGRMSFIMVGILWNNWPLLFIGFGIYKARSTQEVMKIIVISILMRGRSLFFYNYLFAEKCPSLFSNKKISKAENIKELAKIIRIVGFVTLHTFHLGFFANILRNLLPPVFPQQLKEQKQTKQKKQEKVNEKKNAE